MFSSIGVSSWRKLSAEESGSGVGGDMMEGAKVNWWLCGAYTQYWVADILFLVLPSIVSYHALDHCKWTISCLSRYNLTFSQVPRRDPSVLVLVSVVDDGQQRLTLSDSLSLPQWRKMALICTDRNGSTARHVDGLL